MLVTTMYALNVTLLPELRFVRPELCSPDLKPSDFLIERMENGESWEEDSCLVLLGDRGGRELLLGSDRFGEWYLLLFGRGRGILTGAVSGIQRFCTRYKLDKYLGVEGEIDGENGGES